MAAIDSRETEAEAAGSQPTVTPAADQTAEGQPASAQTAGAGSSGNQPGSIDIDPAWNDNDNDSALGDCSSDTTSINASILEYRKMHGRTYQNFSDNIEYWGPNDDRQNEGLDLTHHMLNLALDDKLYLAPIGDDPKRVIDIGTGTGIWAIDFADQFPGSDVIGTDLSPIQPAWVPPNCRFELDDAQMDWPYPDDHFDFIHVRCLMGSIKDWPKLYREIFRCLKPGGWFEHLDFSIATTSDDDSIPRDSPFYNWGTLFGEAGEKMGQTFNIIGDGRNIGWFKDAGFTRVDSHRFKLPMGGWAKDPKWKEVGIINQVISEGSLEGYTIYMLMNVHGWAYEEVQAFLAHTRRTMRDRSIHSYFEGAVVWGSKA